MSFRSTLLTYLRDFRDILCPRYCAACGMRLLPSEQKLCAHCLVMLPYFSKCDFYDNPIARLFWGRVPVERAFSYLRYYKDTPSHPVVMQLKYKSRPDVAMWMGQYMARDLALSGFFEGIECIIPVPLHWRRKMSRGYNQCEQLARGIALVTQLPVLDDCVKRIVNNVSQTSLSAKERISNVEGIFDKVEKIPYHHVLLVDDVLTTGSTLVSFANAILETNPDVRFSFLTLCKR